MFKDPRFARVARGCFSGGVLTTLLLMVFVPQLGFLAALAIGLPAGSLIGYLATNWREVGQACKRAATETFPAFIVWGRTGVGRGLRQFFAKPRPFFWMYAALWTIIIAWAMSIQIFTVAVPVWRQAGASMFVATLVVMIASLMHILFIAPLFVFSKEADTRWSAHLGCKDIASSQLALPVAIIFCSISWRDMAALHLEAGWFIVRGTLIAIGWTILGAALIAPAALYLGARWSWRVMKLVHSHERVVAMVDAPLGGLTTFLLFQAFFAGSIGTYPIAAQITIRAAAAVSGGLLAVGFGWFVCLVVDLEQMVEQAVAEIQL